MRLSWLIKSSYFLPEIHIVSVVFFIQKQLEIRLCPMGLEGDRQKFAMQNTHQLRVIVDTP